MSEQNERHLGAGIVAGVVAGLVASWVMNEFMAGPGGKLQKALQTDDEKQRAAREEAKQEDAPKEDATMKTADALAVIATGGRHLSTEQKQKGGPIVHYAFGALMGGVYGALAEYSSATTAGFGTAFGGALFTGADLIAVPALNLSSAPSDSPLSSLANPFAAHLVYGVTTECVRRLVRAVL